MLLKRAALNCLRWCMVSSHPSFCRTLSLLPRKMPRGTWVQTDPSRPDIVIPVATHGHGKLYRFDEEAVVLPTELGFGYYPVSLGDVIPVGEIAKLRVIRKLGWGNSSTVWLCSNGGTWPAHWPKYVALKIETAFCTSIPSFEADCLDTITKDTSTKGSEFCLQLLAHGKITSVHGDHRIFVTPITGLSLRPLDERYPISVIKNVIWQVLLGLEHMHSLGIVHCDLQLQNIAVALPNESIIPAVDAMIASSPPETYPSAILSAVSSEPYTTIKTQPIAPICMKSDFSDMKVQIIDYGKARPINTLHLITDPTIVPEPIHPPERILGAPLSEKIDIWAVGYLATTMLSGADIFDHDDKKDRSRLYRMIEYLRPFEDSFLARCSRRNELLREDGIPRDMYDNRVDNGRQPVTRETIPRQFISDFLPNPRPTKSIDFPSQLIPLLYDCFKKDPEDRPSASQLLTRHRWLREHSLRRYL